MLGISVLSVYLRKLVGTHADQFNFQDYKHTDMVCLTALLLYCILFTVLVYRLFQNRKILVIVMFFYAG